MVQNFKDMVRLTVRKLHPPIIKPISLLEGRLMPVQSSAFYTCLLCPPLSCVLVLQPPGTHLAPFSPLLPAYLRRCKGHYVSSMPAWFSSVKIFCNLLN